MKKVIKEIIAFVLAIAILITAISFLSYRLLPEDRVDDGARWNMYLEEKKNSIDIMFVGSSIVYCDIIPAVIYEELGHTNYLMSASFMMPGVAYYYMKEAIKTQKPDLIMVEATSFLFSVKESEYSKVNIGYMPYSLNRIAATLEVAPEKERLGLLFPLYNYHSEWENYSVSELFSKRKDVKVDILAGYAPYEIAKPQKQRYQRDVIADEEEYRKNLSYMQRMIELCDKEGIELRFFVAPVCEYFSEENIDTLRSEAGNIPFIDFNDHFEEMGLDISTDFYDARHVNLNGANKFSRYLAGYIADNCELTAREHDRKLWQERVEYIHELTSE